MDKNIDNQLPVYIEDCTVNEEDPLTKLRKEIDFMCIYATAHPRWFDEYHEFRDYDLQTDSYYSPSDNSSRSYTGESRSLSANSEALLIPPIRNGVTTKMNNSQVQRQTQKYMKPMTEIAYRNNQNGVQPTSESFGPFVGHLPPSLPQPPVSTRDINPQFDPRGQEPDAISASTAYSEFIRDANKEFDQCA